jgi:hypothetical protein
MKKLLLISTVLGGVILIIASCAIGPNSASGVSITKEYAWVGGVMALQNDRDKLEDILKHADKSLFRVAFYKNGKREHMGTLGCLMHEITKDTDKDAKNRGLSDFAFQISAPRDAMSFLAVACRNPTLNHDQAEALLRKVAPILEKHTAGR